MYIQTTSITETNQPQSLKPFQMMRARYEEECGTLRENLLNRLFEVSAVQAIESFKEIERQFMETSTSSSVISSSLPSPDDDLSHFNSQDAQQGGECNQNSQVVSFCGRKYSAYEVKMMREAINVFYESWDRRWRCKLMQVRTSGRRMSALRRKL
jgi:hypothetical protein